MKLDREGLPAKRRLAVFDIDGTLTDTVAEHQAAVIRVLARYGWRALNTDLGSYRHHTDSGVFEEAFATGCARLPDAAERASFEAAFEAEFAQAMAGVPVAEIPGAARLVTTLLYTTGWAVAFATGSFWQAAHLKLQGAAIPYADAILSTASENLTRSAIVAAAIARAERFYACPAFDRVVSLGDGLWDLLAAAELKLPFLGVGTGPKAATLAARGAEVLSDLTDVAMVLAGLDRAAPPP